MNIINSLIFLIILTTFEFLYTVNNKIIKCVLNCMCILIIKFVNYIITKFVKY